MDILLYLVPLRISAENILTTLQLASINLLIKNGFKYMPKISGQVRSLIHKHQQMAFR